MFVKTFTLMLLCLQLPSEVSVQDHGAKPDGSTDSTVFIKRALNEVKAKANPTNRMGGTLYFPGSTKPYIIQEPIVIDEPNIKVRGDGSSTKIINYGQGPCFIVGLRTTERTKRRVATLDPRYYPAPPVGYERLGRGRRLLQDSTIGFWGSAYDLGRLGQGGYTRWGGVVNFTAEFAIDFNAQPHRQFGIFSLGGIYTSKILYLGTSGNKGFLDFHYTTRDGVETARAFKVDPSGFNLISIKLDTVGGTCDFWVNGNSTRVAVPINAQGLMENKYDPFLIGCDANISDGRQPMQSDNLKTPDFTIYGLRLSDTLVDGEPYKQSLDGHCVAQLFDEVQQGTRFVTAFSGSNQFRKFYGYHIQVDQSSALGGLVGTTFEDMQLSLGNPVAPVIQTIGTLKSTYRRLNISGGTHAISIYPSVASYPNNLEECELSANDYSIAAAWAVIRARNIDFFSVGRGAVLAQASDVAVRQAFVAFTAPYTETIYSAFRGQYGGRHWLEDWVIDMEGESCRLAPFYIEKSDNVRSGLKLDYIYLGSAAKDRPLVVSRPTTGQGEYYIETSHIDFTNGKPTQQIQERLP